MIDGGTIGPVTRPRRSARGPRTRRPVTAALETRRFRGVAGGSLPFPAATVPQWSGQLDALGPLRVVRAGQVPDDAPFALERDGADG